MKNRARKYTLNIAFITDRVLSMAELGHLEDRLRGELNEPRGLDDNGNLIDATYKTDISIIRFDSSYNTVQEVGM
jgi:hypothetical protein